MVPREQMNIHIHLIFLLCLNKGTAYKKKKKKKFEKFAESHNNQNIQVTIENILS